MSENPACGLLACWNTPLSPTQSTINRKYTYLWEEAKIYPGSSSEGYWKREEIKRIRENKRLYKALGKNL